MRKLLCPTLEGVVVGKKLRASIEQRLPQPVDDSGSTPFLWSDCTAYVADEADDITDDEQDVLVAVAASPKKVRNTDDSPAKLKARLSTEVSKAKADREGGKKPSRQKNKGK